MHLSPVWSAFSSTLRRVFGVFLFALRLLPLAICLVPSSGPALDCLILSLWVVILAFTVLSLRLNEPLDLRYFGYVPTVCLWVQMLLTVSFLRALFGIALGSECEVGQVAWGIGSVLVGEEARLSLIVFVLFLVLQRKSATLALWIQQAGLRFHHDIFYTRTLRLDADLSSQKLSPEQWHQERECLEFRLRVHLQLSRFAEQLQKHTVGVDVLMVVCIVVALVSSGMEPKPWIRFIPGLVGSMAILSSLSFVWAVLLGMCLKGSEQYFLHPDFEERFPSRREMVSALGGLGIETVALAGLGLPPGLSLAVKVLAKGNYRVAELKTGTESLEPSVTAPTTQPGEISVQLGRELLCLVDPYNGSELVEMLPELRGQFQRELGFVFEKVRFTDSPQLAPREYRVSIGDRVLGGWELPREAGLLAVGPEELLRQMPGVLTREPLYGLSARWVTGPRFEDRCAFFSPRQVIASHLLELLRADAHTLINRSLVESLLSGWQKVCPSLDLPKDLPRFSRVLAKLVKEQVSLDSLPRILECYRQYCEVFFDDLPLVEEIRIELSSEICKKLCSDAGRLHVLVLDQAVVNSLRYGVRRDLVKSLRGSLRVSFDTLFEGGMRPIVLTEREIRRTVWSIAVEANRHVAVLSWDEVHPSVEVNVLATVQMEPGG